MLVVYEAGPRGVVVEKAGSQELPRPRPEPELDVASLRGIGKKGAAGAGGGLRPRLEEKEAVNSWGPSDLWWLALGRDWVPRVRSKNSLPYSWYMAPWTEGRGPGSSRVPEPNPGMAVAPLGGSGREGATGAIGGVRGCLEGEGTEMLGGRGSMANRPLCKRAGELGLQADLRRLDVGE
jgi:hypothetical protein